VRQLKGVPLGPKPPPGVTIKPEEGSGNPNKPPPPPPEETKPNVPEAVWSMVYGDGGVGGTIDFFGSYASTIESYSQELEQIAEGSYQGSYDFDIGSGFGDHHEEDGHDGHDEHENEYMPECLLLEDAHDGHDHGEGEEEELSDEEMMAMMKCPPPSNPEAATCDEVIAYTDCIVEACPEGELEAYGHGFMWRDEMIAEKCTGSDAPEEWEPVTDGSCASNCYAAIMKADELCEFGQDVFTDEWGYTYRYEPFEMNYMFEGIGCMFPTPAASVAEVTGEFTMTIDLPAEYSMEFWLVVDSLDAALNEGNNPGEEATVMKVGGTQVNWEDETGAVRKLAAADIEVEYKLRVFKVCDPAPCSATDESASKDALLDFGTKLETKATSGDLVTKMTEIAQEMILNYGSDTYTDTSFLSSVEVKSFTAPTEDQIVTDVIIAEDPPEPGTHTTLGSGPAPMFKAGLTAVVGFIVAAVALM